MDKKYVEFLFPGSFFSESTVAPYKKGAPLPKGAFAYRVFSRQETVSKGERLIGSARFEKATFYAPGSVVTLAADLDRVYPGSQHDILRHNIRANGYKAVVKTNRGNHQPFDPAVDGVLKTAKVL